MIGVEPSDAAELQVRLGPTPVLAMLMSAAIRTAILLIAMATP
jgi:hypothetical protein